MIERGVGLERFPGQIGRDGVEESVDGLARRELKLA